MCAAQSSSASTPALLPHPVRINIPTSLVSAAAASPMPDVDIHALRPSEMIERLKARLEFQLKCINQQMTFLKEEATACTIRKLAAEKRIEDNRRLIQKTTAENSASASAQPQSYSDVASAKDNQLIQQAQDVIAEAEKVQDKESQYTQSYAAQIMPLFTIAEDIEKLLAETRDSQATAGIEDLMSFALKEMHWIEAGSKITIAWLAGMAVVGVATGGASVALGGIGTMTAGGIVIPIYHQANKKRSNSSH